MLFPYNALLMVCCTEPGRKSWLDVKAGEVLLTDGVETYTSWSPGTTCRWRHSLVHHFTSSCQGIYTPVMAIPLSTLLGKWAVSDHLVRCFELL